MMAGEEGERSVVERRGRESHHGWMGAAAVRCVVVWGGVEERVWWRNAPVGPGAGLGRGGGTMVGEAPPEEGDFCFAVGCEASRCLQKLSSRW